MGRLDDLKAELLNEAKPLQPSPTNPMRPSEPAPNSANPNEDFDLDKDYAELKDKVDSIEALADEDLLTFLKDKNFRKVIAAPKEGSILHFIKKANVSKKDIDLFFSGIFLRNMFTVLGDSKVSLDTWFLYYLGLNHIDAAKIAEDVGAGAENMRTQHKMGIREAEMMLLSELTGKTLVDRGDTLHELRSIIRYNPKVLDYLMTKLPGHKIMR